MMNKILIVSAFAAVWAVTPAHASNDTCFQYVDTDTAAVHTLCSKDDFERDSQEREERENSEYNQYYQYNQ
jgi:hypothetical protein